MPRICPLGTGSSGNCFYVEGDGAALLVDAGFSAREILGRMESVGLDPWRLAGLLLTHEHGDHIRGVSVLAARQGIPVLGTSGTLACIRPKRRKIQRKPLEAGEETRLGPFTVWAFRTPHDSRDPVGYLIEVEGCRIAVTTDLGHVTEEVRRWWNTADVLVAESNHDIDMLRLGPYPDLLKARVAAPLGHLSNDALAGYLAERTSRPLRHLVLAHLSQINNDPSLALFAARRALDGASVSIDHAGQDQPGSIVEVC